MEMCKTSVSLAEFFDKCSMFSRDWHSVLGGDDMITDSAFCEKYQHVWRWAGEEDIDWTLL